MSESIKPDYCLSFKRKWFAKIWNGKKTVEYRTVTPKYKRLATWIGKPRGVFMMFYIGMMKTGPRMLVQVSKIDIGKCPLKGFDGDYYRIHFDVVQPYLYDNGVYFPMSEMPKMKEKRGAK